MCRSPAGSLRRTWVAAVSPLLPLPIVLRDERLTSYLAEQRLGPMKRGRSGGPPTAVQREAYRAQVDRVAAAIILQDELDARARQALTEREEESAAGLGLPRSSDRPSSMGGSS